MQNTLAIIDENTNFEGIPATYSDIYRMHKYWAKKPSNLINNLIQKYSKKNEIVLDPFCGSGVSIIESVRASRKGIGIDINPIAIFLVKQALVEIEPNRLEKEFLNLEKQCKDRINECYKVKRKGVEFVGTHFIWSNGKMVWIRYKPNGRWYRYKPEDTDVRLAKSFTYKKIKYYFPKQKLFQNAKINASSDQRICDLFTPRNTYALSLLLDRINKIKDRKIRQLFRFCFSASLGQASKMVFVNNNYFKNGKKQKQRPSVGSWVIGYWVPKNHFEINVWNCFVNRYKRILNAKKEQVKEKFSPVLANKFYKLRRGDVLLINKTALDGLKKIPTNSIDYVITDPPHGDRIPYLELSLMWNSWLQNKVNYENEIVISSSKERKKDVENYNQLLNKTLKEVVRVLKPNRYLTLMFNTYDHRTWSELLKTIKRLGLKIEDLSTIEYSQNSVVQENKNGGLKHDFLLTFKKIP